MKTSSNMTQLALVASFLVLAALVVTTTLNSTTTTSEVRIAFRTLEMLKSSVENPILEKV